MQYEDYIDTELCALLLKTRDQIQAAMHMEMKDQGAVLSAYWKTRGAICREMNRRLPLQLTVPSLIKWAELTVKESRRTENLNNREAA